MKVLYPTGRDYGKPQVLVIDMPENVSPDPIDEVPELVRVFFDDPVRGIAASVQVCDYAVNSYDIGRAVLREYDAGHYTLRD